MNQYNYGNADASKRVNYPIITCGYIKDATRLTVSYGRQRAGLFCVGGVCRPVPANNGLMIEVMLNGAGGGAMPAWKQLSDTELAAVMTYAKNTWSNKTEQIVQPADVVAARK